jgi:hypothetical protein
MHELLGWGSPIGLGAWFFGIGMFLFGLSRWVSGTSKQTKSK